jgi:hypothetical protein
MYVEKRALYLCILFSGFGKVFSYTLSYNIRKEERENVSKKEGWWRSSKKYD